MHTYVVDETTLLTFVIIFVNGLWQLKITTEKHFLPLHMREDGSDKDYGYASELSVCSP